MLIFYQMKISQFRMLYEGHLRDLAGITLNEQLTEQEMQKATQQLSYSIQGWNSRLAEVVVQKEQLENKIQLIKAEHCQVTKKISQLSWKKTNAQRYSNLMAQIQLLRKHLEQKKQRQRVGRLLVSYEVLTRRAQFARQRNAQLMSYIESDEKKSLATMLEQKKRQSKRLQADIEKSRQKLSLTASVKNKLELAYKSLLKKASSRQQTERVEEEDQFTIIQLQVKQQFQSRFQSQSQPVQN